MSQQDNTLSTIGRTLTSLKSQASTMGNEITEQVELIGALDSEVDSTQGRLGRAMGKMDELVRRGDDRLGGWCVWLLIVVSVFGRCGQREGRRVLTHARSSSLPIGTLLSAADSDHHLNALARAGRQAPPS